MSTAPSSAYQTSKAKAVLATGADTFTSYRDLLLAKFLQNTTATTGDDWGDGYFNSADDAATRIAKIKALFKIDGWKRVDSPQQKTGTITFSGTSCSGSGTAFTTDFVIGRKVGALVANAESILICVETYVVTAITSDTAMTVVAGTNRSGIAYAQMVEGFVGYCYSRTSGNGLYHKTERFSGVKLDTTVLDAELLNDAGLNRKADIVITPISGEPLWTFWANWINFPVSMRAAFYDGVTDWGYIYKINAGSYSDPVSTLALTGTLGVKVATTALKTHIDIAGLNYTDAVSFKPYITNGEGTFYGTPITFYAQETIGLPQGATQVDGVNYDPTGNYFSIFATAAKLALLADGTTITHLDTSTGIILYQSEYFDTWLPAGYYVIGAEPTKAYLVNSYGEVRKYETITPATASVSFYLTNLAVDEYPEWRVIAQVVGATGFPNTLTVATVVTYYTKSGETYTPTGNTLNVDVLLTTGHTRDQSALSLIAPPAGATYARVTTTEAGIGLAVISNYTAI